MKILNFNLKIIGQIVFVIIILSTSQAKSLDKFNKASRVSDYFSGILLFSENQYDKSQKFLKRLDGLESSHKNYSLKYWKIGSVVGWMYIKKIDFMLA